MALHDNGPEPVEQVRAQSQMRWEGTGHIARDDVVSEPPHCCQNVPEPGKGTPVHVESVNVWWAVWQPDTAWFEASVWQGSGEHIDMLGGTSADAPHPAGRQ